jgi:outer membrane protein TolC
MARQRAATQRRTVGLVRRQVEEGEVAALDLSQATAQLASAEAALQPFEAARALALFRLATLEGLPPAQALAWPETCSAPPAVGAPLPVGDGAALIARRPDIREAERRLAAATARIDVATADLYPRISLGGSAGLISGGFDAVLTPLVTWAFPNMSGARARIAGARGSEAAALARWDAAVLLALREVESVLAEYQTERLRRDALAMAEAQGALSVRRMNVRHRLGEDSYLPVMVATAAYDDSAAQRIQADLRLAQLQVALFRALGGGW